MKITGTLFAIILLLLFITTGCNRNKKKNQNTAKKAKRIQSADINYLHMRSGKPIGSIRVECADCHINYRINTTDSTIHVKNGNQDRFVYSKPSNYIKTKLRSHKNQLIRLLVIDPNGNILYNVLESFKKGEMKEKDFLMKYTKKPNTVIVNSDN